MTSVTFDGVRRGAARVRRWQLVLGVVAAWLVGWAVLHGRDILTLGRSDVTGFQTWLTDLRDRFDAAVASGGVLSVFDALRSGLDSLVTVLQHLFSQAAFPRPVPQVGWLGVIALAIWIAFAVAGWKMAVLTGLGFASFGLLGYWTDSMDLLIVTLVSVVICLLVGIPLGIWLGRSAAATAVITPVLDVMQTLPSFVYLLPITLLFSIGAPAAVIATLIYALPPVVRITAHGIRTVSPTTLEATTSMGSSAGQLLRKVQLPMAKRTIIVGVNQTMMAALSMATIAALIDGPGLGQPVIQALQSLDVGTAFAAGLAIVIMAIVLDRVTTAAGDRASNPSVSTAGSRRRWIVLGALAVGVLVCGYVSRTYLWAAEFPSGANLGQSLAQGTGTVSDYITTTYYGVTKGIADAVSYGLINPLESLLANSPWYLVALVFVALSAVLAGWRSLVATVVCIAILLGSGLWHDGMVTLATTLVATAMTMVLAVVFGVWMARSRKMDAGLRPVLDAGQTIPPFVYLVPALGLFGPTRFTAIVAAIVYAAPVAIKLVADGIRGVSPTTIEAAESSGSSPWQVITKVQLPMARSSIALAANQGMLYVFSMVVIGGLVGAGGLGYLVVAGFSQAQLFGKGLAAGIAIVALAVMLDRMAQKSQTRTGNLVRS